MAGTKEYIPLLSDKLKGVKNADRHGIYVIHWIASNHKGKTICRVASKDPEGILYIGKAGGLTLIKRISIFKRVINPKLKSDNHSGGEAYNASKAIQNLIRAEDMGVALFTVKDETPEEAEKRYLAAYRNKYGELPPLNSQGPRKDKPEAAG